MVSGVEVERAGGTFRVKYFLWGAQEPGFWEQKGLCLNPDSTVYVLWGVGKVTQLLCALASPSANGSS